MSDLAFVLAFYWLVGKVKKILGSVSDSGLAQILAPRYVKSECYVVHQYTSINDQDTISTYITKT